ncbi:MAG: pyridoxal-phosphate dependent enzyme [Pseudomonadales bacterium]|nr:pyridoxal-phosphate dependent enzyme [Pseudomonadales bacterium]
MSVVIDQKAERKEESLLATSSNVEAKRPLFSAYPALESVVEVQRSALLPTPVQRLKINDNAWIKRDDLTHTEYGGNKIRKLEFILADAKRQGAKRIVTFGAIGTNHGVATAMMCQQFGLSCVIYLFDQPVTDTVKQNLRLMQAYGAQLIYKGSLFNTVLSYYLSPLRAKSDSYFLFAGGSNLYGTLSFVNAAFELRNQIDRGECPQPSTIVCPVGSSATLAGLTFGCQLAGLDVQVKGIRVAPEKLGPFAACTTETVYALMKEAYVFLKKHAGIPVPKPQQPILIGDYYGDGYGVATEKGTAAIETFRAENIKLEQTYTAKAAAAFLDELVANNQPVLYWDTYNSRDMSQKAGTVSEQDLAKNLQRFLKS